MSRTRGLSMLVGGLIGLAVYGTAGESRAELILDLQPGGTPTPCGGCGNIAGLTQGWYFTVTSTIKVGGIGVWDAGANGIDRVVQAGLWTFAGDLLAATDISNASTPVPSNGDGQWLFEDIRVQKLVPGQYVVANVFFDETPVAQFDATFTTIPEITFEGSAVTEGIRDQGFRFPREFVTDTVGLFGPTLRQVPVPATVALFVIALAGLGVAAGRRIPA